MIVAISNKFVAIPLLFGSTKFHKTLYINKIYLLPEFLIRKLDCAVIQTAHQISKQAVGSSYDSVRGVFWEGKPLYKGAGFKEKNHIQICVCNPNCIKGYFRPRKMNVGFRNP